jgi:hypothetical protein
VEVTIRTHFVLKSMSHPPLVITSQSQPSKQYIYLLYISLSSFATHLTIIYHYTKMPTTTDKPLEGLPVNGVFPLSLSPAFIAALGKGKGAKEDVIGLKCTRLFPFSSLIYHPLLSSSMLFNLRTAIDSEDISQEFS